MARVKVRGLPSCCDWGSMVDRVHGKTPTTALPLEGAMVGGQAFAFYRVKITSSYDDGVDLLHIFSWMRPI